MNLLKSLPVLALLAALGVAVTFARSNAGPNVAEYTNGWRAVVAGPCKLHVSTDASGMLNAWPASETSTVFKTTWPTAAGELEFPVAKGERREDEVLRVTFVKAGNVVRPTAYAWEIRAASGERKSCDGLKLND